MVPSSVRGQGEFCFLKFALSFVLYTKGGGRGLSILKVIQFDAYFANFLTHLILCNLFYTLNDKNKKIDK